MAPSQRPQYNWENSDYYYCPPGIQDRESDKRKFVNTQLGVKGWVDGYLNSGSLNVNERRIPAMFQHRVIPPVSTMYDDRFIPIIDLSTPSSSDTNTIMPIITNAATEVGIFKIINHGMDMGNIERVLTSVAQFHESAPDNKKYWYKTTSANSSDDDVGYHSGIHYISNFDMMASIPQPGYWQDLVHVRLAPHRPRVLPGEFQLGDLTPFHDAVKGLAVRIMKNLSAGLKYHPDTLAQDTHLGRSALIGEYYPFCPLPEKTFGLPGQSSPAMLNIMFPWNSEVQVKYYRQWVPVRNDPGTLLVKIGELLNILSNNVYKAAVHRVLANGDLNPKVSAFVPFTPGNKEWQYVRLPHSGRGNRTYRNFTFDEYNYVFYGSTLGERTMVEHFSV